MELVERKKNLFRVEIRRKDISEKMKLLRSNVYFENCNTFINQMLKNNSKIFVALSKYLSTRNQDEKSSCHYAVCGYLTSRHYYDNRGMLKKEGLANILACIYFSLNREKRAQLVLAGFLEDLFNEIYFSWILGITYSKDLFNATYDMSLYTAKRSNLRINCSQQKVQKIIIDTHSQLTPLSLEILTITLINLEQDCLNRALKSKLKQIARKLYSQLSESTQKQLVLRLLAAIGLQIPFYNSEKPVIYTIIHQYQQIGLQTVLNCLLWQVSQMEEQDMNEDLWIFFQTFLSLQATQFQISLFLNIILLFIENTYSFSIYERLLKGRLVSFISKATTAVLAQVVIVLFQQIEAKQQLICCSISLLKNNEKIRQRDILKLCLNLLLHKGCTESEINDLVGQKAFTQLMEVYKSGNQQETYYDESY